MTRPAGKPKGPDALRATEGLHPAQRRAVLRRMRALCRRAEGLAWTRSSKANPHRRFRAAAIRAARSGQRSQIEFRLCDGGGKWIHLHATMEPLDVEPGPGSERRWICTPQDVSAARRAEQAMRASERHDRLTLAQAAIADVSCIAVSNEPRRGGLSGRSRGRYREWRSQQASGQPGSAPAIHCRRLPGG